MNRLMPGKILMNQGKFLRSGYGFSLIEMAVVLTVAGALLAGAVGLLRPYYDDYRYNSTKTKLERIANALDTYAQKYNRMPCPSDPNPSVEPFGYPRNGGTTGLTQTYCGSSMTVGSMASQFGIVPFNVLGLSEDQVKDAYGNFITYEVTGSVTGMDTASAAQQGKVQQLCRTAPWIDPNGVNKNLAKAKFCCGNSVNDVIVYDGRYNATPAGNRMFMNRYVALDAGDPNSLYTGTPDPVNKVAYALISHGKNGDYAFVKGTATRRAATGSATNQESLNGQVAQVAVRPLTLSNDDNYFDDIVLWRTTQQVMLAFNGKGCLSP